MDGKHTGWIKVVAFLFLITVSYSTVAEDWYRLRSPDGRFSIEMPGNPEHTERVGEAANPAISQHIYISRSSGMTFVVITSVYPDTVDLSNPRSNLEKAVDILVKSKKYKADDLVWKKINGFDALEVTLTQLESMIQSQNISLFAGYSRISATISGPPGSVQSPEAKRYIESLSVESSPAKSVR